MMTRTIDNSMILGKANSRPLFYDSNFLTKHIMALGSSGSGKTYLSKVIVEEAVRAGIPVIAIDSQGDIGSLGIPCSGPQDSDLTKGYWDRLDLKIWTPGSSHGLPISLKPSIDLIQMDNMSHEDKIRHIYGLANELAALAGIGDDATVAGIALAIEYAHEQGFIIENLDEFMDLIKDPPLPLYNKLEVIFNEKSRDRLIKGFIIKGAGPQRLMMELGQPMDIDKLFGYETGGSWDNNKVRVSVISLAALTNLEDRQIFMAAFARNLYDWMIDDPRPYPMGMVYIDEAAPYLPPVRKPVCKEPIMTLLRQARKYGVSLLIATQSPGDLDFVGTAQIGTKFIGRITTPQEVEKIRALLDNDGDLVEDLPDLQQGEFIGVCADAWTNPVLFKSRTLITEHKTLTLEDVEQFVSIADRKIYG